MGSWWAGRMCSWTLHSTWDLITGPDCCFHSPGTQRGTGDRGRWVTESCLGSCCPFPPSHRNTDFSSHAAVHLSCKMGKKHGLLMISERLLSHESAHGKRCWKPLHSESLEIRPRQTHNCPLRSTWNTNGSSLRVRDNHPGHPQVKAVHYKFQWWVPKPSRNRGPWTASKHDRQREQD